MLSLLFSCSLFCSLVFVLFSTTANHEKNKRKTKEEEEEEKRSISQETNNNIGKKSITDSWYQIQFFHF
jgi:Ca2+/Na+ antiporter